MIERRPVKLHRALPSFVRQGVLVACFGLGLAACASTPSTREAAPSEQSSEHLAGLERRAVERWQLLIDGKPDQAYDYLTPGYRTTVSRQEYARNALLGTLKWQSAAWRSADCRTDDACEAQVLIGYSVRMSGAGDVASVNLQKEDWLRVEGEWYFLPKP